MKTIRVLFCLALLALTVPAFATDAPVESAHPAEDTGVETVVSTDATSCGGSDALEFPLTFDLLLDDALPLEGCQSCCHFCLALSNENFCTWNCSCDC